MATDVDAKLLRQTKFPPEFNQKVDMKKVNLEVMKKFGSLTPVSGSLSNRLTLTDGLLARYRRF
jgi:serine/arginine repetitive matrix protein 1